MRTCLPFCNAIHRWKPIAGSFHTAKNWMRPHRAEKHWRNIQTRHCRRQFNSDKSGEKRPTHISEAIRARARFDALLNSWRFGTLKRSLLWIVRRSLFSLTANKCFPINPIPNWRRPWNAAACALPAAGATNASQNNSHPPLYCLANSRLSINSLLCFCLRVHASAFLQIFLSLERKRKPATARPYSHTLKYWELAFLKYQTNKNRVSSCLVSICNFTPWDC